MRIGELLKEKNKGISFEFFPPKTEKGRDKLLGIASELKAYNPLYVSVTYGAGGSTRERTLDAVSLLKDKAGLLVMPHLACIGADKASINALLRRYAQYGIENILALRGDLPEEMKDFDPSKGDFPHASDMMELIKGYGRFSIGVAVYPEGHIESPSLEIDIEKAKMKIDKGADFCITQMFFDNEPFYRLRDRMKKAGIGIPVIAGIMPISNFDKIKEFAAFCGATIPSDIVRRMESVLDDPDNMKKVGIEVATKQCEDLRKNGVNFFHFYTLNKSSSVKQILDNLAF